MRGQREIENADLGFGERRHRAAMGIGQELAAQADAEHRKPARDGLTQERLLGAEPGVEMLLIGLLGAAHDEQRIAILERRHRLAPIGLDGLAGDTGFVHDLAEDTRPVDLRMLEDQNPGRTGHRYQSRSEAIAAPSARVRSLA